MDSYQARTACLTAFTSIILITILFRSRSELCRAARTFFALIVKRRPSPGYESCRNIHEAKSILEGSYTSKTPFSKLETLLQSRAVPNQRLIAAFRIENSFTTTDEGWHAAFRTKAERLLNLSAEEWEALRKYTHTMMRAERDIGMRIYGKVDLGTFLQTVVMKMVLKRFFPDGGAPCLSVEEESRLVGVAADKINSLWMQSKSANISKTDHLELMNTFQLLLPNIDISSRRENPLNIILPAYETLWRVVFRCFVEVQFRSSESERSSYRKLLHDYLRQPTAEMFAKLDRKGVSVANIVNETLRIYPPTKRIHRAVDDASKTEPRIVGIDVEFFHRDRTVWGDDSMVFRPERWSNRLSKAQKSAFLPFGAKPFTCPAKRVFAPKIIALLVAMLAEEFDETWRWEGKRLEGDALMGNDRSGYADIYLQPNPTSGGGKGVSGWGDASMADGEA